LANATQHSTSQQSESDSGTNWVSHNVFQSYGNDSDDWLIDSGASVHVVNDARCLHNPVVYDTPKTLHLATSEAHGNITAVGDVCLRNPGGKTLWLHQVKCVPTATANLISVSAGIRDGLSFVPRENGAYCAMVGPGGWECKVSEKHGLYMLKGSCPSIKHSNFAGHAAGAKIHSCEQTKLWHCRMGHPGSHVLKRLDREDLVAGVPENLQKCEKCTTHCEICILGKQTKPAFSASTSIPERKLARIHLDTVGELPVKGLGGERYFLTAVDEWSGYTAVVPVSSKSAIPHEVKSLINEWETQTGQTVKALRSDRGTEFLNKVLEEFCQEKGIIMETSAPYTPQQNGVAERMNRTIKEKGPHYDGGGGCPEVCVD